MVRYCAGNEPGNAGPGVYGSKVVESMVTAEKACSKTQAGTAAGRNQQTVSSVYRNRATAARTVRGRQQSRSMAVRGVVCVITRFQNHVGEGRGRWYRARQAGQRSSGNNQNCGKQPQVVTYPFEHQHRQQGRQCRIIAWAIHVRRGGGRHRTVTPRVEGNGNAGAWAYNKVFVNMQVVNCGSKPATGRWNNVN